MAELAKFLMLNLGVRVNQRICFLPNVFRFLLSAPPPRLLALTTDAWRGAESGRRSAETVYIDLPGPGPLILKSFLRYGCNRNNVFSQNVMITLVMRRRAIIAIGRSWFLPRPTRFPECQCLSFLSQRKQTRMLSGMVVRFRDFHQFPPSGNTNWGEISVQLTSYLVL
jgi:hypothetical protein